MTIKVTDRNSPSLSNLYSKNEHRIQRQLKHMHKLSVRCSLWNYAFDVGALGTGTHINVNFIFNVNRSPVKRFKKKKKDLNNKIKRPTGLKQSSKMEFYLKSFCMLEVFFPYFNVLTSPVVNFLFSLSTVIVWPEVIELVFLRFVGTM